MTTIVRKINDDAVEITFEPSWWDRLCGEPRRQGVAYRVSDIGWRWRGTDRWITGDLEVAIRHELEAPVVEELPPARRVRR